MSIATLREKLKMRIEAHNCKIFQNKNIFTEKNLALLKKPYDSKIKKKLLRQIEKLYLINCFTLLISFGCLILNIINSIELNYEGYFTSTACQLFPECSC